MKIGMFLKRIYLLMSIRSNSHFLQFPVGYIPVPQCVVLADLVVSCYVMKDIVHRGLCV